MEEVLGKTYGVKPKLTFAEKFVTVLPFLFGKRYRLIDIGITGINGNRPVIGVNSRVMVKSNRSKLDLKFAFPARDDSGEYQFDHVYLQVETEDGVHTTRKSIEMSMCSHEWRTITDISV